MTAQTRERLINALIATCICVIISLFILYTAKDYTKKQINNYEKKNIKTIYDKLDAIFEKVDETSNKLDSIK